MNLSPKTNLTSLELYKYLMQNYDWLAKSEKRRCFLAPDSEIRDRDKGTGI